MSSVLPFGPAIPVAMRALARVIERAGRRVDTLYAAGHFRAAEDLDALVTAAEELLEDNGDFEENGDRENDLLSEVDEDAGHERPTELPEDEVHDDDLDFAYGRGRYDRDRRPRFNDDSDGDLDFLLLTGNGARQS